MSYEEQQAAMQAEFDTIVQRYQPEIQALEQEGQQLASDGKQAFKFDLQVGWGEQTVAFDVPQVTMHTQTFSLDLPQVTVHDQTFTFSTPSVRMVTKKVGQYPEFHGFTVRWKDILIDVPEVFMEEQRVVVGIPEIRMDTTSFALDVPEVQMERVEWRLRVPEVRLGDISILVPIDKDDLTTKADALKERGQALQARMQQDIKAAIATGTAAVSGPATQRYSEALQGSTGKAQLALTGFDDALGTIDRTLATPSLPEDIRARLTAQRTDLTAQRAAVLAQLTTPVEQHAQQGVQLFAASFPTTGAAAV
ncbi:hypothetical protein [uncultured Deinococcus sp.]|uniref:hypothetical protein n=1 Tax=uncultured Deinococcus sp. TaxID=158789 RepID=UPI0025F8D8AD|nr:hypothetical protein [uncultured Deinococcus sp.]